MASNNRQEVFSADALRSLLSSAITSHESAEVALLHIMKSYHFTPGLLQQILTNHIDVSFSKVEYEQIAPFVGLDPNREMHDIETFDLHRSRIPTALFKTIVQDIDVMMAQYGPPVYHQTEEATSRFMSPIFNRLIDVFGFAFRNLPESTIKGRITTKGRVEYYFKAIGSISVLFIEVKRRIGSAKESLNAVAQIIAECAACDWNNARQGYRVPVYGILCDGDTFQFFHFDGATETFKRGSDPNNPITRRRPFRLPDPTDALTTRPFIDALRPICEIIFGLLLNGYHSSLKAYYDCSMNKSAKECQLRKSGEKWEEAMNTAFTALRAFEEAEIRCQNQLIDEANSIVERAMEHLKCSVNAIPILDKPEPIMSSWDDVEVEKV